MLSLGCSARLEPTKTFWHSSTCIVDSLWAPRNECRIQNRTLHSRIGGPSSSAAAALRPHVTSYLNIDAGRNLAQVKTVGQNLS